MLNTKISIDDCLFITQLNERLNWVIVDSPIEYYSIYAYFLKIKNIPFKIKETLENDESTIVLECGGLVWNSLKFDNRLRPIKTSIPNENEVIIEPIPLNQINSFSRDRLHLITQKMIVKQCDFLSFIQLTFTKKESDEHENPLKFVFPFSLTTDYNKSSEFKNKIKNINKSFEDLLITFNVFEPSELPILSKQSINTFKRKKMSGIIDVKFSEHLLDFKKPTHSFIINTHLNQAKDLTPIGSSTSSYFLLNINLDTIQKKLNFFKFIQQQEDLGFFQLFNNNFEIQNLNQKNNLTMKVKTNNYIGDILIRNIITHNDLLSIENEHLIKKTLIEKNSHTIRNRF